MSSSDGGLNGAGYDSETITSPTTLHVAPGTIGQATPTSNTFFKGQAHTHLGSTDAWSNDASSRFITSLAVISLLALFVLRSHNDGRPICWHAGHHG